MAKKIVKKSQKNVEKHFIFVYNINIQKENDDVNL